MAGADVVDRDGNAKTLQGGDDTAGFGQALKRLTFSDFQYDLIEANGRLLKNPAHVFDNAVVIEMGCRQIESNLEMWPGCIGGGNLVARAAHQCARHLENKSARF